MARSTFRDIVDKIFPTDDGKRRTTSELVERGLEALRMARDERSFVMGDVLRVPSHLELRVSQEVYDQLKGMEAMRDMQFFFTDELMKELTVARMRTFGDHAVRVGIAVDSALQPDELYAQVLSPETGPVSRSSEPSTVGADSTIALDMHADSEATQSVEAPAFVSAEDFLITVTGPTGAIFEGRREGRRWLIGRRGSSGRAMPQECRKIDLDVRETVSREQVMVEVTDDRLRIERVGKASVALLQNDQLGEGESRMIEFNQPFYIEDYQVVISR